MSGTGLQEAEEQLKRAGVADAAGDARRLLTHVLDLMPGQPVLWPPQGLTALQNKDFSAAISRRTARQPVSQIIGKRAFYNGTFKVTPDVLDPRPETETLVSEALKLPFSRLLDLGTGSGCIAVSLLMEAPKARAIATDISAAALKIAAENAAAHNVAGRLELCLSHWFAAIDGKFDLIVSNPPYIAASEMAGLAPEVRMHEPRMALTDEADGLAAYRCITASVRDYLLPGGRLMLEIGWQQGQKVAGLLEAAGLENVRILPDMDGRNRLACGRMP